MTATFHLGAHHPNWLWDPRFFNVPLFVSHRRLRDRRTPFPRALTPWALDSGGFTQLAMNGGWSLDRTDALAYRSAIRRYHDEIGLLRWAAPQDWMCEPGMRQITGRSIEEHQRLTCQNYCMLRSLWGGTGKVPIIPVLQGWSVDDYRRHYDMYVNTFRVDLENTPLVGVGSVCRRSNTRDIARVFAEFPHLNLHGFGVKLAGLRQYGGLLASADSMAWSYAARRAEPLPGHESKHKNCANCPDYALAWRRRVVEALSRPSDKDQPALIVGGEFNMALAEAGDEDVSVDDVDWRLIRHYLACRAGHHCEICGVRLGPGREGTVHHRLPRGMGGTSDPDVHRLDRLMLLCGGALGGVKGCHGMVEANGTLALANGWKVPHGAGEAGDSAAVPVLLYTGRRVLLDPYGPFYLNYREAA